MKRILIPLCAIAMLAGCATTPEPGIEVRKVEVPTPVACVNEDEVPAEPPKVGDQLTGDASQDLLIVSASALELRKYGGELRALIIPGCVRVDEPEG